MATTVDIPTTRPPRVVVRTLGEAVAETGLRFSTLTLTPQQVELLDRRPQHVYFQGPPGTGKTLLLFLGTLQSALDNKKVVIVHQPQDVAVATLFKTQLVSILKHSAPVQIHSVAFGDHRLDVEEDVKRMLKAAGPGVHIIFDEVPWIDVNVLPVLCRWLEEVRTMCPDVMVWMGGLVIRDNTALSQSYRLPSWVECCTVRQSLRCPPNIAEHVEQRSDHVIDDRIIPRYRTAARAAHTAGPEVRKVRHWGQQATGHTEDDDDLVDCEQCATEVAAILHELHVGQPGGPQHRDVWVLTGGLCPAPSAGDRFVLRLQEDFPQTCVVETDPETHAPLTDDGVTDLALAVHDHIVVTDCTAVRGLERSVIIVLRSGGGWLGSDVDALSRSTSFLCYIT